MRIQKQCPSCAAVYTVAFTPTDEFRQDSSEEEEQTDFTDIYPEFCPFCGTHDCDEVDDDDDEQAYTYQYMWLDITNKPFEPTPEQLTPACVGFVYLITNLVTGRKYVGKKLFWSTRRKAVKGKTRKKKFKLESDWREYYGSNGTLNQDVAELGAANFKRQILHICTSKSECSYFELKEQIMRNAIISTEYYNDLIWVRINRKHLTKLQFGNEIRNLLTT